jgi:hypothetical protein
MFVKFSFPLDAHRARLRSNLVEVGEHEIGGDLRRGDVVLGITHAAIAQANLPLRGKFVVG